MPALDDENPGVAAVGAFKTLLLDLLAEASAAKQVTTVEPALHKTDFSDLHGRISSSLSRNGSAGSENDAPPAETVKARQFAVVETAARDLFAKLIATTAIDSPDFVKMWNLLDILSILSDDGLCDPALLFWLVEELLDSQTIAGCRKIFDFLESRRERITAKHFKQKNLVILRSCNELLRRLSRAEDTAFCGRVFIFMFQSFPLGDRSSVNLRGEYHVENVTSYETPSQGDNEDEDASNKMEVDPQPNTPREAERVPPKGPAAAVTATATTTRGSQPPRAAASSTPIPTSQPTMDTDALYPLFWSLQESFSQPLRLFDPDHFAKFRSNLDSTMNAFQMVKGGSSQFSKSMEDKDKNKDKGKTQKQTQKRKREEAPIEAPPEDFNPKYLTSKDLFQLEISDLSFRRHVLVQALIITDFLLSCSASERERLTNVNVSNKSVVYPDQLSEDKIKWAAEMKSSISEYLKNAPEGAYFHRMVETVLARDKNWVFWKMASCPPIQRDPISPASFNETRDAAQRLASTKRLRANPFGALPLDFLRADSAGAAESDSHGNGNGNGYSNGNGNDAHPSLRELTAPERHQLPDLESFRYKIADDDFEIERPTNSATKAAAVAGKASKSWRALRIASRSKLVSFDRIDDPKNIDVVFSHPSDDDGDGDGDGDGDESEDAHPDAHPDTTMDGAEDTNTPRQPKPIILCVPPPSTSQPPSTLPSSSSTTTHHTTPSTSAPTTTTASSLIQSLMTSHEGVFAPVVRHTTREPRAGEGPGQAFHFVTPLEFGRLRDGDRFVEHGAREGADYGTSTKAIEAVAETGKVPIIELDVEAAQFAKEMSFPARYILISPSPPPLPNPFDTVLPSPESDALARAILPKPHTTTEKTSAAQSAPEATDLEKTNAAQSKSGSPTAAAQPVNGDADMQDAAMDTSGTKG